MATAPVTDSSFQIDEGADSLSQIDDGVDSSCQIDDATHSSSETKEPTVDNFSLASLMRIQRKVFLLLMIH